jgi:hypothetical protein
MVRHPRRLVPSAVAAAYASGDSQPMEATMTTTMRAALDQAMHNAGGDPVKQLADSGLAVADEGTMTQAIHDVYCGITADHDHPSEKDRDQARALIAALQKVASSLPAV